MILSERANGVVVAESSLLAGLSGITHAVSTRLGGASTSPSYASLNLSWKWNASHEAVAENHQRLCDALHLDRSSLVSPRQVHGTKISTVDLGDRGTVVENCDGLISQTPGVTLLLRFADCVPILLYDCDRRVIGCVHAGWRGTVGGIATEAVKVMVREYRCHPADIIAIVGPAIGPCCYEVGADVIEAARRSFGSPTSVLSSSPRGAEDSRRLNRLSDERTEHTRMHLDLWSANERLLRAAGVARVDVARICTACENETFYSYRAGNGRTGAHGALICLHD